MKEKEKDKDIEIIKSISSERVIKFFSGNKDLIMNNSYLLLSLLGKDYLIDEIKKKVYKDEY